MLKPLEHHSDPVATGQESKVTRHQFDDNQHSLSSAEKTQRGSAVEVPSLRLSVLLVSVQLIFPHEACLRLCSGRLRPSTSPERTNFLQKTIRITHGGGENGRSFSRRLSCCCTLPASRQEGQLRSQIYADEDFWHRWCACRSAY